MRLPLITESRLATYRRCPREHYYRYVLGYRAVRSAAALIFGDLVHRGLEAWWLAPPADRLPAAWAAMDAVEGVDAYEQARARVLLCGYTVRWQDQDLEAVAVEAEFRAPLPAPSTDTTDPRQPWVYSEAGRAPDLRGWRLAGKLDVLARRGGEYVLVEHKTTSEDLSAGSPYWVRLRLNGQISTYYAGARAMGYEVSSCVYDVLAKPDVKPRLATPAEERRYRKDGGLYLRQRDTDESPEDYQARLLEAVTADIDQVFQRVEVVRLREEMAEHRRDLYAWAARIASDTTHARNTDACSRYGRMCDYWDVCTGAGSLESSRYQRLDWPHPELTEET